MTLLYVTNSFSPLSLSGSALEDSNKQLDRVQVRAMRAVRAVRATFGSLVCCLLFALVAPFAHCVVFNRDQANSDYLEPKINKNTARTRK